MPTCFLKWCSIVLNTEATSDVWPGARRGEVGILSWEGGDEDMPTGEIPGRRKLVVHDCKTRFKGPMMKSL